MAKSVSQHDPEEGLPMLDKEEIVENKVVSGPTAKEQMFWLVAWFVNNIGITIANKSVFQFVDFKYPYALSAVHMICNTIGAYICIYGFNMVTPKQLGSKDQKTVIAFSALFAANISIGNMSLRFVSVAFNQVCRATVPVFVMCISYLWLNKTYSVARRVAVVPIVVGVAIACYGDISFTPFGFCITLLAVSLAALKAIVSGVVLTGDLKFHPVDLIWKMAPLACGWMLIFVFLSGEGASIMARGYTMVEDGTWACVFFTGAMSFTLNIASFFANQVTSPLTLTVSGNVKQALVIIISVVVFKSVITAINAFGIMVVLFGSAWYSKVGYMESQKK